MGSGVAVPGGRREAGWSKPPQALQAHPQLLQALAAMSLCPQKAGLCMAKLAREGFTAGLRLGRTSPRQLYEQLHQPTGSWAG